VKQLLRRRTNLVEPPLVGEDSNVPVVACAACEFVLSALVSTVMVSSLVIHLT
jgi:hypothetical protein